MAARQMLDGFDSSSTNIASDHGAGNGRRSTAITCGRFAYPRRLTSTDSRTGRAPDGSTPSSSRSFSKPPVDLGIWKPQVHGVDIFGGNRLHRESETADLQCAYRVN